MEIKLAIDFDGTIANTNDIKSKWVRDKLGLEVPPELCSRTKCVPIIGIQAYEEMSSTVYGEEYTRKLSLTEGCLRALNNLSQEFGLILLTARTPERLQYAEDWMKKHDLDQFFHEYVNQGRGTTKIQIAREKNCAALIDDDERHLATESPSHMKLIWYNPGKLEMKRNVDIKSAHNWKEVEELLAF